MSFGPRKSKYEDELQRACALAPTQWLVIERLGRGHINCISRCLRGRGQPSLEVYAAGPGPYRGQLVIAHPIKAPAGSPDRAPDRGRSGRPRKADQA